MSRLDRPAVVLYLCAAIALGFVDHRVRSDRYRQHVVTVHVPSVLAGTSGAPAKYRVLMPYALDWLNRTTGADAYLLFLFVEAAAIAISLLLLHWYLRRWYSPSASLGGTLALATFLPLTFTNSWAHPDTFPDLALFTAGCLAVAGRRDLLFAAILAAGMLNRETTGFLVLLWAAERLRQDRRLSTWMTLAAYLAICGSIYTGLRWARGYEDYQVFMLPENLQMLKLLPAGFDPYTRVAGYFWLVLLGPAAWLAARGARRRGAPSFFRGALLVAAVYGAVVWLFAAIIEVRVLVPLMPLLLPGALHVFADVRTEAGGGSLMPK